MDGLKKKINYKKCNIPCTLRMLQERQMLIISSAISLKVLQLLRCIQYLYNIHSYMFMYIS